MMTEENSTLVIMLPVENIYFRSTTGKAIVGLRPYERRSSKNFFHLFLIFLYQGCVLIIGGMDQTKMNCDRLFNLLCIYGNVLRVMFIKKKTELALVEMGNSWQAREAIHNLRRIEFLGMEVEISLSNQNCVNPIQ